jgi:hypothetical protein
LLPSKTTVRIEGLRERICSTSNCSQRFHPEAVGGVAVRDRLVEHHGGLAVHACREASRDRLGDPGEGRDLADGGAEGALVDEDLEPVVVDADRAVAAAECLVQAAEQVDRVLGGLDGLVLADRGVREQGTRCGGDLVGRCHRVRLGRRGQGDRRRRGAVLERVEVHQVGRVGVEVARHLAGDAELHRRRLAGRGLGQGVALERAHLAEAGFGERRGALADRPDGQRREEARPVEVHPEQVVTARPAGRGEGGLGSLDGVADTRLVVRVTEEVVLHRLHGSLRRVVASSIE